MLPAHSSRESFRLAATPARYCARSSRLRLVLFVPLDDELQNRLADHRFSFYFVTEQSIRHAMYASSIAVLIVCSLLGRSSQGRTCVRFRTILCEFGHKIAEVPRESFAKGEDENILPPLQQKNTQRMVRVLVKLLQVTSLRGQDTPIGGWLRLSRAD